MPGYIPCCGSVLWSVQPLTAALPTMASTPAASSSHHHPIRASFDGLPAMETLCRSDTGKASSSAATARTTAEKTSTTRCAHAGSPARRATSSAAAASAAAAWMTR